MGNGIPTKKLGQDSRCRAAPAIAATMIPNLAPNNAAPIAFGAIGMLAVACWGLCAGP